MASPVVTAGRRMRAPYAAAEALREATGLACTAAFAEFSLSLREYVCSGTGEAALQQSSRAAAIETRRRGLMPERMLRALHMTNGRSTPMSLIESLGSDSRYARAIGLFLQQYFPA